MIGHLDAGDICHNRYKNFCKLMRIYYVRQRDYRAASIINSCGTAFCRENQIT
jgi:hypothetical protein